MMIQAGQTTNFIVSYDDRLAKGAAMANAVLAGCENDLAQMSALFGGILPATLPFQIELKHGAGSAGHATCLATTISYPAKDASPQSVLSTVDAEVAEVLMATQNLGFNCSFSNGEALSRVVPTVLYPERTWAFSVGNDWLNSPRQDYVTVNDPTDQNPISIGCGTLFLNYLAHQLNLGWQAIITAAGNTLGQTAANLGVPTAFADFSALLALHFPAGTPTNLPDDNPFPLLSQPTLYIRHNLADNGTSHTGPESKSPDIIVKNTLFPQDQFATQISIASDNESDRSVLAGQTNYLYVRVWNRGTDATDVTADVYWSPPATLVTPSLWTFITGAILAHVPGPGNIVEVTQPLAWDQSLIPAPGHYCFIATVGNAENPAPSPGTFSTFDDFVNYIAAHNNIAWRNFNVVANAGKHSKGRFQGFVALPFLIPGAWDRAHAFVLETTADLPKGALMAVEVPSWLGRKLEPAPTEVEEHEDTKADGDDRSRSRISVKPDGPHVVGQIELPAATRAASHMLVSIPAEHLQGTYEVAIRQLYKGREVGRITWRLVPDV
ncbi:MAG TPA: hypothetical protein VLC46_04095 [Thermoanaerobaculia bacterium]|jgi:hypothetical protein|nr:hypothetical protein [Thermoanaerobaculia bacterium]